MSRKSYKVLLMGRVNVGKSTLFNRLTKSRRMIVSSQPGATRDRVYGVLPQARLGGPSGSPRATIEIIDCAGYEPTAGIYQPFNTPLVWEQSRKALDQADGVLLVMDGLHGFHALDKELAVMALRLDLPVLFVVNKIDDASKKDRLLSDFYNQLPLLPSTPLNATTGELIAVSGTTAYGIPQLISAITEALSHAYNLAPVASSSASTSRDDHTPSRQVDDVEEHDHNSSHELSEDPVPTTGVAIIGKPNSGKSSLLNRLTGAQRSCVSEIAGTTRDVVDVPTRYRGLSYTLFDTAGVRRRVKVKGYLEKTSVMLTLKTIRQSQITLLVIDALEGFTHQDAKLVHLALQEAKPLIVVINKRDLIPKEGSNTLAQYERNLRARYLASLSYLPIRFISALNNERVHQLYETIESMVQMSQKRVPTARVNEALEIITRKNPPHGQHAPGRRIKFYYITQVSVSPPTFLIKSNKPATSIYSSYKAYLESQLRKQLGLDHVPIRLMFKSKDEENREKSLSQSAHTR